MSPGLLEPGVIGLLRPILLLPEGITERLTPSQLEAVLAHELCHVRRDNLFASLHMIVEALFWFHPLVWWIGARLVAERERACDEEVLMTGNQPRIYADAILNVCRLYVESPLVCVSGVTGANIRKRIEAIMMNRGADGLNRAKKLLLAGAGIVALAGPVAIGVVIGIGHVPAVRAQSPIVPSIVQTAVPSFAQAAQVAAPAERANAAAPSGTAATPLTVPTGQPQDRRLAVMMFDFDSIAADRQSRARQAGIDYLRQYLPADLVAVVAVNNGTVKVGSDFTDDAVALESAIRSVYAGNGSSSVGNASSASVALDALDAIAQIANMLAVFPEKKVLVYFSSGVTGTGMEDEPALERAINAAERAKMAIYPVNLDRPAPSTPGAGANTAPSPDSIFSPGAATPTLAQAAPTVPAAPASPTERFEVASVKPSAPPGGGYYLPRGGPGTPDPGLITWSHASLLNLLMIAYDVTSFQVSGLERVPYTEYDIVAKVPAGATKEQARVMWQNLLAERFGVVLHHESKEFQVEELVIDQGGSKLKEADWDVSPGSSGTGTYPPGKSQRIGKAQTISQLAGMLCDALRRPVFDKTGLTGKYDYTIDYVTNPQYGPDIAAAVQEQLGLRLVPSWAVLDVVVVDKAEKAPTVN